MRTKVRGSFAEIYNQVKMSKIIYFLILLPFLYTHTQAYPEVWEKIQVIEPTHNEVIHEPLKVNINTADKITLQKITGIGPKKSQAIVDFREQNGPFKKITDLEKIKGFSKKVVAKLIENNKDLLCAQ